MRDGEPDEVGLGGGGEAASNAHPLVVAIGASAGGLDALRRFFAQVPTGCQYSFVVIQHLSPDYKSIMGELLEKSVDLPIREAAEDMAVERGHIYLIPSTKNLVLQDTDESGEADGSPEVKRFRFGLVDKPERPQLNLPIDLFFRSLAKANGNRAIGVVLSGTGSDGSEGVRAIKQVEGLTLAQSPETAPFDGMPRSAIATGLIDLVLPIEEMLPELDRYVAQLQTRASDIGRLLDDDPSTFQAILDVVAEQTKIDFASYKTPTLQRRISRRVALTGRETPAEYLELLRESPDEVTVLHREFLVGVTYFFRDPAAWKVIETECIPKIFQTTAGESIKVWSVGCSTGEEAYSLAILFHEYMEATNDWREVKIFATDVYAEHVQIGSEGFYPATIEETLSEKRLARFFERRQGGYRAKPQVRGSIIFSRHDAVRSPPFLKLDLVVCRNMLIYLAPETQQQLLSTFNVALKESATLFLGPSESLGNLTPRFREVDGRWRIYENLHPGKAVDLTAHHFPALTPHQLPKPVGITPRVRPDPLQGLMLEGVAASLSAGVILVDGASQILHAVGCYRKFLSLPADGFSTYLLDMLPEELRTAVAVLLRRASRQVGPAGHSGIPLTIDGEPMKVRLWAAPAPRADQDPSGQSGQVLVIAAEPAAPTEGADLDDSETGTSTRKYLQELESELQATRENLQFAIEHGETSSEELQATNEELLSANEELQSTNEELQSLNEELHTVNAEHQLKIEELAALNADMNNLLKSSDIGTLFVDPDLRIRKFTPAAKRVFNLMDTDVGRPIQHFSSNFGTDGGSESFVNEARKVILSGEMLVREVRMVDGTWYLMRMTPFVDSNDRQDGLVVTFVDISQLRELQEELADRQIALENVLEGTMAGYWDRRVREGTEYMSPTLKRMFGYSDDELRDVPESWERLVHPDDLPIVRASFDAHIRSHGEVPYDNEVRFIHKDGSVVWVWRRGKVIEWDGMRPIRMVGSHVDLTPLKEAHVSLEELREAEGRLQRQAEELRQFAYAASHDLREPLNTISSYLDLIDRRYGDALGEEGGDLLRRALGGSERMRALLAALLEYSRLQGIEEMQLERVEMADVVQGVVEDLQTSITRAGADLEIGALPAVQGHPALLKQVVQNLLSNALKFRREGVAPRVRISSESVGSRDWRIVFEDNGIGIDPQYHARIFEIFKRLHTQTEFPGTGLGLAICRKIVALHGGSIGVAPAPESGCIFSFTLEAAR